MKNLLYSHCNTINYYFFKSILTTGLLNIIAVVFYYKALKSTDISLAVPMLFFTPIFLIVTSFIFLKELPSIFGISGILLIVIGSYILNMTKNIRHLSDPFKNIFETKGIFYMLIVAFIFSISSNFDKLVVQNSDPYFGSSLVNLLLGCFFLGLSLAKSHGNSNFKY